MTGFTKAFYTAAPEAQRMMDGTTVQELKETLRRAREKLMLYRKAHSGEYIGGMEYTELMRKIDAALKG